MPRGTARALGGRGRFGLFYRFCVFCRSSHRNGPSAYNWLSQLLKRMEDEVIVQKFTCWCAPGRLLCLTLLGYCLTTCLHFVHICTAMYEVPGTRQLQLQDNIEDGTLPDILHNVKKV